MVYFFKNIGIFTIFAYSLFTTYLKKYDYSIKLKQALTVKKNELKLLIYITNCNK